MSSGAASFTAEMRPVDRLEVLCDELAELSGQRNAIDSRVVEIVAAVAHRIEQFPRCAQGMRGGHRQPTAHRGQTRTTTRPRSEA